MRLANKKKLYLSGPMTGHVDYNFPAFNAAATDLRARNYTVENPAEHFDGRTGLPWEIYLAKDMQLLVEECWGVATLPGWAFSRGARLEVSLADYMGLAIMRYVPGMALEPINKDTVRSVLWTTTSKTAASVKPTPQGW